MRRPHIGAGAPQRSFFNPYVTVDEAKDEPMVSDAAYSSPRRHSGIELPTYKRVDNPPEGFMEHRKKHEAAHAHHQGLGGTSGSDLPHFMQRHKSFDEQYRRVVQNEESLRPSTATKDTTPMYDQGYNPFSFPPLGHPLKYFLGSPPVAIPSSGKWSEYWPFGPLKKPQHPQVELPPYWAIPSTVPASKNPHVRRNSSSKNSLHVHVLHPSTPNADDDLSISFRWGSGDLPKPFVGAPPLRSHSTENIDIRFSPSVNPPKFGESSDFSSSHPSGHTSDNPIEIPRSEGSPKKASSHGGESSPVKTPTGPPPKGPACFFPNDWHQRAWAGMFQADPGRPQSRTSSQRRPGTPRASSSNDTKRSGQYKAAGLEPSVNDPEDEPPSYSTATGENLNSSRVSSDGSAMDIDPVLTPPSGNDNNNQQQENDDDVSPTRPNESTKSSNQSSALPPRVAVPVQPEADSLKLGVDDFKHVKPFGPGGDGLEAIDDLSQALPFESRASSARPPTENTAQGLKLPKPPKAPLPPKPLNPTTWQSYVSAMGSYMSNWSKFNNTMLSHFHIRQEAQKQMNYGWMSVQGDNDYNAYLQSLTEDEKVRKWWEVACDIHKDCINTLGRVRVAMKEEMARAKNFPYPS